jgi:hypothetical protein
MKSPYVVPSTARRDLWIGLAAGAVFLALILLAVMNMANGISGSTLNGKIVEKHFTPLQEERVTLGKGGLSTRQSDGEYVLECVAKGRAYLVTVDKETYQAKKVGDTFLFARPRE